MCDVFHRQFHAFNFFSFKRTNKQTKNTHIYNTSTRQRLFCTVTKSYCNVQYTYTHMIQPRGKYGSFEHKLITRIHCWLPVCIMITLEWRTNEWTNESVRVYPSPECTIVVNKNLSILWTTTYKHILFWKTNHTLIDFKFTIFKIK